MEEQNTSIPAKSKRVEVVTAILVHTPRGSGTKEDPYRIITEVWSQDGRLIAVEDPEIRVARAKCARRWD